MREPEARQFIGARDQLLHRRLVHLDDLRNQQNLPLHAVPRQRGFQFLIDDALMRGVLVHHDQAVAGLRHDIGLVNLGPRRPQRAVEQIGRWRLLEAHIGGGRADVERGLARFGKGGRR